MKFISVTVAFLLATAVAGLAEESKPLRALLIAGGCCHDYAAQHKILSEGIRARANVVVDVILSEDRGTAPRFPIYDNPDWAKGYDVVIHDECAAGVKDLALVKNILHAHKTVPAVNLHCAMHSYRTGTDDWFKFIGLQSNSHNWQKPIAIKFSAPEHPIIKGLADWTTVNEELYNNVNVLDAKPLAMGTQEQKQADGSLKPVTYVVAWTNETAGARSFSTTIGHNNETVADARYLDLVTRGLLWACDKLNAEYLKPYTGAAGTFVSIPAEKKEEAKAAVAPQPPVAPKDATAVTVTASSEESGKGNFAWKAVDGSADTRWCAGNASKPQWLQFEFEKPQALNGCTIAWESRNNAYQHTVEGSGDGKTWTVLADATQSKTGGDSTHAFAAKDIRLVKITCTGTSQGGWASIREVSLKGEGIKALAAKSTAQQHASATATGPTKADVDPYKSAGNITPRIEKLTAEKEAAILKDVTIPDGFEATVFAAPPAANYPVFIAAAPNGDLYVSSDGNGSLGRAPHRGRILRLRDKDNDGRADEVTEFVKDLDAPRGLVWDHDRLYVVHPPDLSVFIDKDGDGVAEERKELVKGIAFGYDQRPADHTTNGLSLGIDGWLYIAGGDFGFMDAVGPDGKHLQHRSGGVLRVRPDGSGLEIYSTGTRNILEVAISPTMDIFARDNTNDGGGWDIRFHHFTGLDDHGYPRLFKNFNDECIQPLAIYGGGSGCGAVYIDEPGFGEWNNAPFTADWGTGALWHHSVKPKGATFEEAEKPKPFIKMTRPTDADVDAMSRVYCASWKGATFNWEGPDVGYIVCVKPKGFTPEPLPNFTKASDVELVKLLDLQKPASYRRRIEAQRELMRRGSPMAAVYERQLADYRTEERNVIEKLKQMAAGKVENEIMSYIGHRDPVVAHVAIRALVALNKPKETLFGMAAVLGHQDTGLESWTSGMFQALGRMHDPEVVDSLAASLAQEKQTSLRKGLLSALCRLHFHEGEWKGDSWGTRPDTRGPYYQPEAWSETPKIAAALKDALSKATPEEAAFLVSELNRNRIQFDEALDRILTLAAKDVKLIPDAVGQLASAETIPVVGIPLLIQAAQMTDAAPQVLSQAIVALAKTDSAEGCRASLIALITLSKAQGSGKEQEAAKLAFLGSPKLENHHQLLEVEAEKIGVPTALWADMALLSLSVRAGGSPESRELSGKALDAGWQNPQRRVQILKAVAQMKHNPYADKVLAALDDPDKKVADAAKQAANAMKLKKKDQNSDPLISTLKTEDVIAQVIKAKGDVELGEQLFTRTTCVACHTTSADQPPKGPFLGNIAQTYKRPELAQNILEPMKTVAQGFATNMFLLKDGSMNMGFVTDESGDKVTVRNVAAQESTYKKSDIAKRDVLPGSIMPPGLVNTLTVHEFASLLDYLESLAKK